MPASYALTECVRNSYGVRILAVGFFGSVVGDSDTLDGSSVRCQRLEQPTGFGRPGLVSRVDNQQCDVYISALVTE